MQKNILITGGTGLVGTRLTEKLLQKGYSVSLLSRQAGEGTVKKYRWDIKSNYIDNAAIANADCIVHLAGAGVFDKRWTDAYKKEIMDSRVESTRLLNEKMTAIPNRISTFIGASAIGIYGADTGDEWQTENSPVGEGYLAEVTNCWEKSLTPIEKSGIRTVKIRIGIVFSNKGGALTKLVKPIINYVGSPMGSGNQYLSWIHLDDLCDIFIYALENPILVGAYNAVAAEPVTNSTLTKEIASIMKKPLWLPNIPSFVMKLIVGSEQASILLGGNRVSGKKITEQGFHFNYPSLQLALKHLLKNDK